MKQLTVWVKSESGSHHNKKHIHVESGIFNLNREDRLFAISKALYDQKKIPAINLIAYR